MSEMSESSDVHPKFAYDSPLERGEVRLLRLLPVDHHSSQDLIRCEIRRVQFTNQPEQLDSQDTSPIVQRSLNEGVSYIALSYTWGEEPIMTQICCTWDTAHSQSSKPPAGSRTGLLEVTENLEIALRHLREQGTNSWLWIDAICINQKDEVVEKPPQLLQMPEIYHHADYTLVWLGPERESSSLIMNQLKQLGEDTLECGLLEFTESELRQWPNFDTNERGSLLNKRKQSLERVILRLRTSYYKGAPLALAALSSLADRDWFERAWVVQEIAVAADVVLVCGEEQINFRPLVAALLLVQLWLISIVGQIRHSRTKFRMVYEVLKLWWRYGMPMLNAIFYQRFPRSRAYTTLGTRRKHQRGDPNSSLKTHLARSYTLESSISLRTGRPHDRIYALLGVSNDASQLAIVPNYKKDWEVVYEEVARALIQQGHLDILSLCRVQNSKLPSWVPDWTVHIREPWGQYIEDGLFDAPFTTEQIEILRNNEMSEGLLTLQGYHVDNLANVGSTWVLGPNDSFDHNAARMRLGEVEILVSQSIKYSPDEKIEGNWRIPIGDKEYSKLKQTRRATTASFHAYLDMKKAVSSPKGISEYGGEDFTSYMGMMQSMHDSRPFLSRKGYAGICPSTAQPGDMIFIPLRAHVPYVIRRENDGCYVLIGEAYVHGIMKGEYVSENPTIETVMLR